MDTKLLILFIVLNAANVIIQTVKSLCTINGSKLTAATANAVAYGLYTVVVVYMVCELPLLWKVLIIGGCNFVGVFIVKWVEEKSRKDKLWKVEMTVKAYQAEQLDCDLNLCRVSHNHILVDKWAIFNCYCSTQAESTLVKELGTRYKAKFFVSETKSL